MLVIHPVEIKDASDINIMRRHSDILPFIRAELGIMVHPDFQRQGKLADIDLMAR